MPMMVITIPWIKINMFPFLGFISNDTQNATNKIWYEMLNMKHKINDIKSKCIVVNDFKIKVNTNKILVKDVSKDEKMFWSLFGEHSTIHSQAWKYDPRHHLWEGIQLG